MRQVAAEIKAAEAAGGSFWDDGAAIAERHGTTIWQVTDYLIEEDKKADAAAMRVTVAHLPVPTHAIDLRGDADREFRIVGLSYWVSKDDLLAYEAASFYLHREPTNRHDTNAVAVCGGTRKLGYLAASAARQYAPLLDELGSSFIAARHPEVPDRFLLPRIPALRSRINLSGAP